MRIPYIAVLIAFVALSAPFGASALDASSEEALRKTQEMLRDSNQRATVIQQSPDAQRNNTSLESMAGSKENTNAVYDLSADVFADLVKQSNGDPVLMQEKLEQAQKNPEAFLRSLSADKRQRIESLAGKIEGGQKPAARP